MFIRYQQLVDCSNSDTQESRGMASSIFHLRNWNIHCDGTTEREKLESVRSELQKSA
jgi:hypothetical protein